MKLHDPVLIKLIEFCIMNEPSGTTYKAFADKLSELNNWGTEIDDEKQKVTDYYHKTFFAVSAAQHDILGVNMQYFSRYHENDSKSNEENLKKFILKTSTIFDYYDYLELKQAREDSKSANLYARIAIFLTLTAVLIDIVFRIIKD